VWKPKYKQFRVFQPAPAPIGYIGRSPVDSFSTDITVSEADDSSVFTQPNFAYPYDIGQGQLNLAMSNNDTVKRFNTTQGTFVVPITGAVLAGSILNYQISISTDATCYVGSDDAGCQLNIILKLARPGLVKAVVILTVVINWLITLAICVITGEAVLLQRAHILGCSDILAICMTALFALPTVRSVLPGAPQFGCLVDLIGILPNIILISICTIAFAVAKTRGRLREDMRPHKSD